MLKVTKENLEKSKVKLTVTVPSELMRGFFSKVYNELAQTVEVKGFRKGKAPKNLTLMQIGENRITSDVIDLALKETYPKALEQEKIIPVCPPKINITKMVDLTVDTAELEYDAEVDLLPEIKLGDYYKIRIKNKESRIKVEKAEIDQVLSHLCRQHAEFKDIERAAKEGDRVEMDFEGKERGVVLENLTSKNYPVILGSKVLIPEFEKKIEGMKKGEKKEFKIKIKEKNIDFKVDLHIVQEVILPKLDDELAKKFGQVSLKKLTSEIEKDILNQKKVAEKQEQEGQVVEALLKIAKVEIPESLVDQEIHRMIDQLRQRTEATGIPFEKYLESLPPDEKGNKKTEHDLHHEFEPQAEKTVKIGLILGEIGKQEKIDLSKEDAGRKVMEKMLEIAQK